jgi:hypothetical protein
MIRVEAEHGLNPGWGSQSQHEGSEAYYRAKRFDPESLSELTDHLSPCGGY